MVVDEDTVDGKISSLLSPGQQGGPREVRQESLDQPAPG